ncbi:noncanonical pyrimidine nucleotidase, YjjG family [bacterium]|nr:noncanonical pyrimidine nucleotidase, YjjG family [bacterium]
MIKAILMDIDNTILDFRECSKDSMKKAYLEAGLNFENYMFDVFTSTNEQLWEDIEKGILTKEKLLKIRWNTVFRKLNIDYDGVKFEGRFRTFLETSGHTVKGAKEVLDYLSKKYKIYAASNGFEKPQLGRLRESNLIGYFDDIFLSEKAGYSKPSRGFFDYCFKRMGNIDKEEVIIIGDSLHADMKGGIDYGIKTCWFNYKKDKLNNAANLDYIIEDLTDIYSIL